MLIRYIHEHPNMDISVFLSGSIGKDEFGKTGYIGNDFKTVKFFDFPITGYDGTSIGAIGASSQIMTSVGSFLAGNKFDAAIVVGDRFETLPCALACAHQGVPIIHIQGGETTGSIDEKIRHSVTKLSDYHFCATSMAKKYLIRMGEDRSRVFNVGCPSIDILRSKIHTRSVAKNRYIISLFHPDTDNQDAGRSHVRDLLSANIKFCAEYGHQCYWFWPNPDYGRLGIIDELDDVFDKNEDILIPMLNSSPEEFLSLLAQSRMIVGNSSAGLREAGYLGVPCINIGNRQGLRERSWNVVDIPSPDSDSILSAMKDQHEVKRYPGSHLYGDGRSCHYIMAHLEKMVPTKKRGITYPLSMEFRDSHLGEARFVNHTAKGSKRTMLKSLTGKRASVSRQPVNNQRSMAESDSGVIGHPSQTGSD